MSDQQSLDLCETESVTSDTKSTKSTASISKPTGIKPPSASVATARIGRPCCAGHTPKPGIPHQETKNNNMRRQSDDYSRSHLSDVFEESEADLMPERSARSIKSKSPDSFSSKPPKTDRKFSNGSTNSDLYMEATGRRHSSDQGTILTTDTDSFIIGQRIWVGGIRPGLIAYIGETHFAPGEWAGVVLDDPNGKNDGCVAGKRYFQCEPKRGIFSRLTRLTREPLPGGAMSTCDSSMNVSSRSITSPSRSGTVSPTHSMKSFSGKTPSKTNLSVGDRVIVSSGMGSRPGVLQYIGETKFAAGNWCGVQLDEPTGKNDGSVDGFKYFDCPAQYGIFVPLAKVSLSPSARKSRLSRAGSKESLTSVGTLGSIASTATSRLRMSAQRLSSTAKPITTPKNTFSLQEVLREKQNHIEHLLIERDLDRQDSETNAMMFQKTVNQLKETITSLEKQLTSEKQKTQDLQTSVDEATFCTEELNVLTQEYKDRVAVLEAQVSGKEPPDGKPSFEETKDNEEISRLRKQIELLNTNLVEKQSELHALEQTNQKLNAELSSNLETQQASISELTSKVSSLETSEKSLQDQVEYMTRQNEEINEELRLKDTTKEQEYLNMKHIENELREEVDALRKEIKQREDALAGNDSEIQKLIEAKDTIIAEKNEAAIGSEHLHMMIVKQKEEEIAQANKLVNDLRQVNESLSNEKLNLTQEIERNVGLIDTLQMKVEESSTLSSSFGNELEVNRKIIEDNKLLIEQHKSAIKVFESKVAELSTTNSVLNEKQAELLAINATMSDAMEKGKILEAELRTEIQTSLQNLTESEKSKSALEERLANQEKCVEEQQQQIKEHQKKFEELTARSEELQVELNCFRSDNVNKDEGFAKLSEQLKSVTTELNEKCSQLEASEKILSLTVEESKALSERYTALTSETEQLKATLNANIQTVDTLTKETQSLNTQIDTLTTNNSTLSNNLRAAQNALESTKLENVSQSNVTKELQQEIDGLQKTLHAKDESIDKLQKTNESLQAKLDESVQSGFDLQEKFSKLEVEYADLNRKMGVMEEKCEQLLLEKASLQQNVDALQNSSSDTNSEVHRLATELQQKQKSYEELLDKSNSTQLSLEKTLHETSQNLAYKITQWERVKVEMETVTMQKVERENELNSELANMKEAATDEKSKLMQEIDTLKVSHQEEKRRLCDEIDEKLKASEVLRQEIDKLAKTVDQLQIEVEQSKKEMSDKEGQFEAQMSVLRSVEDDLKKQLDESNRKESELRNTFSEATNSSVENVEKLTNQLSESSLRCQKLESNIAELQTSYDKTTAEHNELKSKLLAVEKTNEELVESIKVEQERFVEMKTTMEQQLQEATSKFKSTEDDQVDLVNRNDELTKQLLESKNSNGETADQLAKVHTEFAAFKLAAEAEKGDIDAKLAESHRKEIELSNTAKLLESQIVQLKVIIEDKQKEIEIIAGSLSETKNDYEMQISKAATFSESTNAEITSLKHEATEHVKTIRSLENKIEQLTSSVNLSDDLKNELSHKSEEIKSKETKIVELSKTVDALQKQIDGNENELKRLAEEKETETKNSMDSIANKEDEIKSMNLKLDSMSKTLEDKVKEFTCVSDERSSLLSTKSSLDDEISRLNSQIKDFTENFVNRAELDNLKEEFSIYEETKQSEIAELTKKVVESAERFKSQSAGVDKLDIMERELKEMSYEKTALQRREAQLVLENNQLADKLLQMKATSVPAAEILSDNDTGAQISFLNSIIADMQRKNETLTHRIQALESAPSDFVNNGLFDMPVKRKPAPRLFCDICDEFDAHETEDCPLQSSDSPPPINLPEMKSTVDLIAKERKLPPPRKFCDHCEVFGHDASECDTEETF